MARALLHKLFLLLSVASGLCSAREPLPALTNIAQFHSLSSLDANRGCPFSLTGIVTLADSNRNLLVLQDATGALAVYPDKALSVQPGQLVSLQAASGAPYSVSFPDYPYRPSGWDIRPAFEAPTNWGSFHLTRLSGYLHPPVTGDYTFWIASDNSSQLWLSADEAPRNVRKIAYLKEGLWVNPLEWSRYASQRSEPVLLQANRAYYIEAFHEQLEKDEHLAVAWQGPELGQAIIDGRYLTPWHEPPDRPPSPTSSSGILREYWTNYSLGSLVAVTGERPIESAISARGIQVTVLKTNTWPEPRLLSLDQELAPKDNFRWVRSEGTLSFLGIEGNTATLELRSGQGQTLVHVAGWKGTSGTRWKSSLPGNWQVRVEGVCEGAYSASSRLMPGVIWADSERNISFFELPQTEGQAIVSYSPAPANTNSALGGFFLARGVVTFNDRVLGQDCLFVQDINAGVFISQADRLLRPQLRVGQAVEIGGELLPGKQAPRLHPQIVNLQGLHPLPEPVIPAAETAVSACKEGQWTELEGVVRRVKPNGTLVLRRKGDAALIWIGRTPTNELAGYVDATVRVRGVLSLETQEAPLLLVPSRSFVEVMEPPCSTIPLQSIASLSNAGLDSRWGHRVKVSGVVTYRDGDLLFVQDASGAARVQTCEGCSAQVGERVEVTGFPEGPSSLLVMTDAQALSSGEWGVRSAECKQPRKLDLAKPVGEFPNQILVRTAARLLGHKKLEQSEMLELQAGQRLFEAVLAGSQDSLSHLATGSLLELTGVCVMEAVTPPAAGRAVWENASLGSVHLLLRIPADVVVLRGPPWWTWKRTAGLIALLLVLLAGAMLRVSMLRRRFEKQQAARLAFARQLLQNQESERRRIAANLHDTLGQNLLAIKNQAHLAQQSPLDEAALHRRLEDISGTVLQALEEVRQITHDLRPYQLDRLGLTQAIRALVRRVSEGCPIEFASYVDPIDGVFEKDSEIHIYRIVQESLNNVVKHSQATEATVVLKNANGVLTLSIRDNGRGLEPGRTTTEDAAAGFGLNGIRERVRIMGGRMEVDAPAGQGFNLKVELPLSPPLPCTPK